MSDLGRAPSRPANAADLLRVEREQLVALAHGAVHAGLTGRTHLVAAITVECRWRPMLARFAPPAVWADLAAMGAGVARILVTRKSVTDALRELDGDHPSTPGLLALLAPDPAPGRFLALALHPRDACVGEVVLYARGILGQDGGPS